MAGLDAAIVSSGGPVADVSEIEVLEALGEPTRFRFRVGAPVADGDIPALSRPAYDPGASITIVASNAVITRGVVTGQRARLSGDSETSCVDVMGADRSVEMDAEAKVTAWTSVRASDAVTMICVNYAFVPDVEPTGTFYNPLGHELVQRGTDLSFVRRLARRHGCLFWISVNSVGLELAHFRPPPVDGSTTASLSLHLDRSSFDELSLEWDADRPTSVTSAGLDTNQLSTIDASVPASPLPPMAGRNLAAVNGGDRSALAVATGHDAASLTGPANSLLADAELFVRASATTTHARAGTTLHAHELVHLDGLGRRHSGNWLISGVRHLIDAVSHRMECTFVRNGWEA